MKAIILIGSFGTRLLPLTFSRPTPLVEFCNQPLLSYQISWLVATGVNEVIVSIGFQAALIKEDLHKLEIKHGVRIVCLQDQEGRSLAAAKELLTGVSPFFVIKSDVMFDLPLQQMLSIHQSHQAEGTILITKVEEPSTGAVVISNGEGKVRHYVENAQEFVGSYVDAGVYLLNQDVLDRPEIETMCFEKPLFAQMIAEDNLHSLKLEGFWMNISKPKDYLRGTWRYLENLRKTGACNLRECVDTMGNVLVDSEAKIGEGCLLGPNVVIGEGCVIEDGVRLVDTVILPGAVVKMNSRVSNSIIGWYSTVGRWARIEGITILAEDVQIQDELFVNGALILPHKGIAKSIAESRSIVM